MHGEGLGPAGQMSARGCDEGAGLRSWRMLEVGKASVSTRQGRPTMTEAYDGRQVVGMDLHRRRSVLVRMTEDGRKLETVRITNSPAALRAVIARGGEHPRVVVE